MSEERKYLRFTISDRGEHWVQMLSFTTLAITGLAQKYAGAALSVWLITALGGIESVRIIHRIASVGLMLGTVYHLGSAGYKIYVKRAHMAMLPTIKDLRAAWDSVLYNIGRIKNRPQQGRYTFDEKLEYWAFVWGTLIMGISGFMLWNPIASARFLPGVFIPAAKAAHTGEALLAVLAIIIWHFYNVHIKHLNTSMFTGYLTENAMQEEHILELADIKAGLTKRQHSPALLAKRKKTFFTTYSIMAVFMLVGIYFFITIEETSLQTIPPAENVVVFVQFTPTPLPTLIPTSTPAPDAGQSWNAGIAAMLVDRCGACHAAVALGGFDLTNYNSALKGGNSGLAIITGSPAISLLITQQQAGNHPGQLSADEIDLISSWITLGAPEE